MPILYRYLIRETLAVFLATNLILLAILLSFRLSSLLAAAAAGNMALSAVWQLVGLQAVRFLVVLMPIAFVLAAVIFAYGWTEGDLPLIFFCLSFLIFELRKIVARYSRSHGKSIANAMQGFSLVLILGALALVLTT